MSVTKTIKEEFETMSKPLYRGLNEISHVIGIKLDDFANKLDAQSKPRFYQRVVSVRNWITHLLLWIILSVLLTSCFVSGRTIRVATPRVEVSADTATAFTLPYKNNSVTY